MKRLAVVAGLGLSTWLCAQDWAPAGLPLGALYIKHIEPDFENDALYFTGFSEYLANLNPNDIGICRYVDGQWDTLGVFNNVVYSVVNYHDTLFAAGLFSAVNGVTCERVAAYDGTSWIPYGEFNQGIHRLRVLEDELYACGAFTMADGQAVYGVAKRVGASWQVPHPSPTDFDGIVSDVATFNGDLYVGGSFDFNGGLNDLMRFDGSAWIDVGGSLLGGISAVNCFVTYNGQLIVAGTIPILSGNAGNSIMSWDGSEWHPLGLGLLDADNSYEGNTNVLGLRVQDEILYVGGDFHFAGGVPARSIAQWDGSEWCNVGGADIEGGVWDLAFYHDTLFIGTADDIDGVDMNAAALWVGGVFADTCSSPMAVQERSESSAHLDISPNPTSDLLTIRYPALHVGSIELTDAIGRVVLRVPWRDTTLDVRTLNSGVYQVRLHDEYLRPVANGRFLKR